MSRTNRFGQPIGVELPEWVMPALPSDEPMIGTHCRLDRVDPDAHASALYDALVRSGDERSWTYLPYGPFDSVPEFRAWLDGCTGDDPLFFAITRSGDPGPSGVASYLRISPEAGSIEVGHIHFSQRLRRTAAATEAMYLMMRRAFSLGYRRYEWKCDALNDPSRRAAERLGFQYEGTFRNATVYKRRSRDTAWYAVIDSDWPRIRHEIDRWLGPDNFGADGRQRSPLAISRRGRP